MARKAQPGIGVADHDFSSMLRVRVMTAKTTDAFIVESNGGVQMRHIFQFSSALGLGEEVIHPHGMLAPNIDADDSIMTALAGLGLQT